MLLCRLEKLNDRLDRGICAFTIFLMAVMTLVVWLQVFQRYVMNASLSWSEELARYMLVWVSFFGASVAMRRGQHLSLDLLRNMFTPALRRAGILASEGIVLIFWLFVIYYGTRYAIENLTQLATALPIAYGYVYIGIPIGAALMALQSIENLLRNFSEPLR